jgi:bHLH factor
MNQSPDVTMEMESDQNNNNENSSNNNLTIKKNEKYSLRQRGQRKSITNKQASRQSMAAERKSRCIEKKSVSDDLSESATETSVLIGKVRASKEKPKQKAAPLSKYRRKTANARERTRMREINHAFESLRQSVPVVVAGSPAQSTNEKLTKITTLRMAMKYIKILSDILDNKTQVSENLLASLMEVDTKDVSRTKSPTPDKLVTNVLASNHHDYCKELELAKPVKASKVKKATKAKKPSTTKSSASKKIKQQAPLAPPVMSISRNKPSKTSNVMQSGNKFMNQLLGANLMKYDLSPCLTPPNDDGPSELGLILESDGESLQLSEPCFSPLEFGLLLESDGESLHLSEPCLSPLSHLDAFNSINDLLHGSFNDHNSLEMYLS